MRKLVYVAVGFVLASALPIWAYPGEELTHPITSLDLVIEDYAGTGVIDCSGGRNAFPIAPARKLRISPRVESPGAYASLEASEHFDAGWLIERRTVPNPNKPNSVVWVMEERTVWGEQQYPEERNLGGGGSAKFNVAYATVTPGQPNGGSSTNLQPGVYRITVEVFAHASGNYFVQTCGFTVV